jgi:CRISPR-associated endoribonuclease Cas6
MPIPEMLSLVLTLRPLADSSVPAGRPLPSWWGSSAHALLLSAIDKVDPALAGRLHDGQGLRPFTASNLIGRFPQRRADPAQTYTLRFTALTAEVSGALIIACEPGGVLAPGTRAELDYLPFTVESATFSAQQHPWAGEGTYQALMGEHLLSGTPAPRRIRLRLASPTGFRSAEKQQPFPLPELVFGSLLERWNSFSPLAFPPEALRYAVECLGVSGYRLRTYARQVKEGALRIGCVGEVTYTAVSYDRYWMGILHTLAAYSFFSGVGAATSLGLGQAVKVESEERQGIEERE